MYGFFALDWMEAEDGVAEKVLVALHVIVVVDEYKIHF
jgi:hypothetical protein